MLKMTADQLRDRIAAAARTVQLRLGPNSLAIATGGGTVPLSGGEAYDVADAVLAVVQPLLDQCETLQLGAIEREALLAEARDDLEAAGQNGAHGDDWPAVAPAIKALAADRDHLAAELATARHRTEMAGATIERMKRTNRMVNGGAREARERAERAEAALAAVRQQVAADIRAYCPDHGTAATCRMQCHCQIADELTAEES